MGYLQDSCYTAKYRRRHCFNYFGIKRNRFSFILLICYTFIPDCVVIIVALSSYFHLCVQRCFLHIALALCIMRFYVCFVINYLQSVASFDGHVPFSDSLPYVSYIYSVTLFSC